VSPALRAAPRGAGLRVLRDRAPRSPTRRPFLRLLSADALRRPLAPRSAGQRSRTGVSRGLSRAPSAGHLRRESRSGRRACASCVRRRPRRLPGRLDRPHAARRCADTRTRAGRATPGVCQATNIHAQTRRRRRSEATWIPSRARPPLRSGRTRATAESRAAGEGCSTARAVPVRCACSWHNSPRRGRPCPAGQPGSLRVRLAGRRARVARVQEREDREDPPMVVGGRGQTQGAEDALDVLLDRMLGHEQPLGDRLV
jgi:hypothetical protein